MIAISNSISIGLNKSTVVVNTPIATAATGIGTTSFTANWNAFSGAQYYLLDVSTSSSFATFVYQDQVILAPTTAYVVIGLTENTTYYYRVRASTDAYIDPDYLAFFNRVIAAGGFLTIAEQDATKQLVADLKANSLWTPMKAIYPMVGASAAACAQNLKSSSFTGTFTSGWTFASTGVTPNGTSAYMDTNLVPNTQLDNNSTHLSSYTRTNADGVYIDIGTDNLYVFPRLSNNIYPRIYSEGSVIGGITNSSGFFMGNRTSSTVLKGQFNSNITTFSESVSRTRTNLTVYLGGLHLSALTFPSIRQIAFSSIGDGLTDTQASNFYTAVQKFNQSLNRQVGAQIVSDPDAQAYIDRVYTAGGTLTNTEATAVNQLTIDLKSNGTWSSMKAIYPMIGASAAACAQNLRSSSFTGTFSTGWTFASTGVKPNGTTGYMSTGANASQFTANSQHFSNYSRQLTNTGLVELGLVSYDSGRFNYVMIQFGSTGIYTAIQGTDTLMNAIYTDPSYGLTISNRRNSSFVQRYNRNNKLEASSSSASLGTLAVTMSAIQTPSPLFYGTCEIAFGSMGDGLTDTDATNLYTAVQNFNQTLDRQVGAQIVSDPDAQSYINRVYTAGGTLTNLEANAVNKLAIDMKAAGLWTSMKAVYPMIGSSAASCAQNLKSSSFTGTFSSGWTFDSTGVTPNGTSAYFNTTFNPTGNLSVNSQCYGYYSRSNTAAGSKREMGGYNSLSLGGNEDLGLLIKFTGDIFYSVIGGTTFPSVANTDSRGLFIMNRTSGTNVKGYKNNSLLINATQSTVILLNMPIYIGCRNTNTTPSDFTDRECAFSSIGDGLSDTQSSDFYTLVQSFNQTLGRSVGSQIVSDADAQAYVNRVYNAGGSLTNTEANAVNQLVLDMKTAGIWDSMKAVYPMVGSSAAACAQNLKSSLFTGSFTAGWTFASTGATPNGTSAYFDTTIIPSTSLTLNSTHISMYSRTNTAYAMYDINAGQTLEIVSKWSDNIYYYSVNAIEIGAGIQTSSAGFFNVSRTASNSQKAYYNGAVKNTSANSSTALPIFSLIYGALNEASKSGYSHRQTAFLSAGDGLTDVQATALYNSVQIFQNTLGRAITP